MGVQGEVESFEMYREAGFAGDIVLTTNGLEGAWHGEMRKAKMASDNFTFRRRDWLSGSYEHTVLRGGRIIARRLVPIRCRVQWITIAIEGILTA